MFMIRRVFLHAVQLFCKGSKQKKIPYDTQNMSIFVTQFFITRLITVIIDSIPSRKQIDTNIYFLYYVG